ncbi:MAG: hypothetical protein K2R98_31495 [Gemmataceae bacterium]|nr:hypothetical protein [Gemmataceae bacterium]
MSHPLDFTDGFVQCDRCGNTFPVGEAQSVLLSTYREDRGEVEYRRTHQTVCPKCFSRVQHRNFMDTVRHWGATFWIGVLVLGMMCLMVFGVLRLLSKPLVSP